MARPPCRPASTQASGGFSLSASSSPELGVSVKRAKDGEVILLVETPGAGKLTAKARGSIPKAASAKTAKKARASAAVARASKTNQDRQEEESPARGPPRQRIGDRPLGGHHDAHAPSLRQVRQGSPARRQAQGQRRRSTSRRRTPPNRRSPTKSPRRSSPPRQRRSLPRRAKARRRRGESIGFVTVLTRV